VGTATVTITGVGNYAGSSAAATFTINTTTTETTTFTSTAALETYLRNQPANSVNNPYTVALNVNSLGDGYYFTEKMFGILLCNGKYVNIDLSGSSIRNIPDFAFYDCILLTGITMPNTVTSIGEYAFLRCDKLTSITIPSSVKFIGDRAFVGCDNLDSVTFEGTIIYYNFDGDAFADLGDLREKFYATNSTYGTPGTYTRDSNNAWTKQ